MTSEGQTKDSETSRRDEIARDDGFWRFLIGPQLDEIPEPERTLNRLVDEFYKGRKPQINDRYISKDGLVESLRDLPPEECVTVLLTIWADQKWSRKKSGISFHLDQEMDEMLKEIEHDELHIEPLERNIVLVWEDHETSYSVRDEDRARRQMISESRPLFLRKSGEESVELRGPQRRTGRFSPILTDIDGVQRIEKESESRSIITDLESIFDADFGSLTLTKISFSGSRLPDSSGITLRNENGIARDIQSEKVRPQILNIQTLSDLEYISFSHQKTGKQISVKTVDNDSESGFHFEIDDSYFSEEDKKNIRIQISNVLGISFDTIYMYDAQHRSKYVVHQILSGDVAAYDHYYDQLTNKDQEFVDMFADLVKQTEYVCDDCAESVVPEEDYDSESTACETCGSTEFSEEITTEIQVDHDETFEFALSQLTDLSSTIQQNGGNVQLNDIGVEKYKTTYNQYIKATVQRRISSGKESDSHYFEYLLYCYGDGQLPRRVNGYLFNSVLITYGNAHTSSSSDFGKIDLYRLFKEDSVDSMFVDAVENSRSKMRKRRHEKADKAKDRLVELQKKVNDGTIGNTSKESLKSEYNAKDFERDVFHLLKFIFPFTERWGREGKKETDGCLVIPNATGEYFVASYDPKLTYDERGYNLDAGEKNKAAYYLLSENDNEYIDHLTGDSSLNGHIFISDIFREGQFETVPEQVKDWFALIKSQEGDLDLPVIFLKLEHLLSIYEIYDNHYDQLESITSVKDSFAETLVENLTQIDGGSCVISDNIIDSMEEAVIRERQKQSRKRKIREYTE